MYSRKKQSKMTNPLFFQASFVTSSRKSKNAVHSYKNDTQVYYWRVVLNGVLAENKNLIIKKNPCLDSIRRPLGQIGDQE